MASQNLKRKKLPHFYESEGVFYLFGFPRNYLFELSETAFDTRKVQICLATSETLKTSLRRVISLKYRLNTVVFSKWRPEGRLGHTAELKSQVCKTKKESDREGERDSSKEDM